MSATEVKSEPTEHKPPEGAVDSEPTEEVSDFDSTMGYLGEEYGIDEYELDEEGEEPEEEEHFVSIFDILDAPRILPEPIQLDESHLDQLSKELGLIRLCWPEIKDPLFEERIHFPESYLKNSEKEKLLLYYAESFRRQFHYVHPNRKPLLLAAENECGLLKMVCTTIRPTKLPYNDIEDWEKCSSFVGDHLIYEALEAPTLIPNRLLSPHTVFLRKKGTSFDISTALCSLLIGLGYDAYVISGYATRDVTMKIMTRVDSPYPEIVEKVEEVVEEEVDPKYVLKPPRDLRSKFLMMMEQREIDKVNEEKRQKEEEERKKMEELEKPPFDELHGLRVHAWILIRPGKREIEEPFFIEASTGYRRDTNSDLYCGIESVWNHENYWVNMQDCSKGTEGMNFDLSNVKTWEHLLVGEPHYTRVSQFTADMEDEEIHTQTLYQEKHLDMPAPWSSKIDIPHEVIQRRYPEGMRTSWYKRVIVEEFAPYVMFDGTVQRISRYHDLDCSPDQLYVMEERFSNRHDKMIRRLNDPITQGRDVYFLKGREDAIKRHIYNNLDRNKLESPRTIEYYSENRFDSMSKIELDPLFMTEHYIERDDKLCYRHVVYAKRGEPPPGFIEGPRRIIMSITEKFDRNPAKKASEDIACREFDIIEKEIRLKYHYDEGKVTASTRKFTKPPMAELGDRLTFDPALTSGYQAEIGAPPPRQLTLFQLLEQQINAEKESLRQVRETEDLMAEWLKIREYERIVPKLDISLFNREQNIEYRKGMIEREQKQKETREKEVEEDIDFLGMYLFKVAPRGKVLHKHKAMEIEQQCLNDFKKLMVARAMDIQHQFEKTSDTLQEKQQWYSSNLDNVTMIEEEAYFKEMNDLRFWLHTLQIRLVRLRELSGQRYEALVKYLQQHKALAALYPQNHQ